MTNHNRYKSAYDLKHKYYKLVPNISIPPEIMENISFKDNLNDGWTLYYNGLKWDRICEYIGTYHLCGVEGLKNKHYFSDKEVECVQELYLKPKKETMKITNTLNKLNSYSKEEVKEMYFNLFNRS